MAAPCSQRRKVVWATSISLAISRPRTLAATRICRPSPDVAYDLATAISVIELMEGNVSAPTTYHNWCISNSGYAVALFDRNAPMHVAAMVHFWHSGGVFPFEDLNMGGPSTGYPANCSVEWRDATGRTIAEFEVTFDEDWHPIHVRLERSSRTTAAELKRFPWARWLDVCQAYVEERRTGVVTPASFPSGELLASATPRRPGRRGHPPAETERLAHRFAELKAQRDPTPWRRLQREYAQELRRADPGLGGSDDELISLNTLRSRVKRWNVKQGKGQQ